MALKRPPRVSVYDAGQLSKPTQATSLPSLYERIKEDPDLRKLTEFIQRKHADGIREGFKTISKTEYQAHKKKYLEAVCMTGDIDRSQSTPAFYHNGRINFDLDENEKADLDLFARLVEQGHVPFCEALGHSISGHITGHRWMNATVEIPEEIQHQYSALEALHKRYFAAIAHSISNMVLVDHDDTTRYSPDTLVCRMARETLRLLKIRSGHRLSIKVGTAKDLKRIRYITADRNLLVKEAKPVRIIALEKFEAYESERKEVVAMERKTVSVVASDHFDWCHKQANAAGYDYVPGQRQNYLARFSIYANLIGIPEDETRQHILDNIHDREDGDFISYPYKKYKESHGIWAGRVKLAQATFQPMEVEADAVFKFNKYLEDCGRFDDLLEMIHREQRTLLSVPTGSGKTHSATTRLYESLKQRYPGKPVILIAPLAAITEQVGINAKHDFQIVCGGYEPHQTALFTDSVCTLKSFVEWSKRLHDEDLLKDVILMVDEAHELVTAASYQNTATLPYIMNKVCKVVGLSATPLWPLRDLYGFRVAKCERTENPRLDITVQTIRQDEIYKAVSAIGKDHKKDKVLYFYNSTSEIEKLANAAKRQGLRSDFFHAKRKRQKVTTYRHLIDNGTLPDNIDHLFSTKILGSGTSFKKLDRIVYITRRNTKDFMEFMQSYARLREDTINVTLLVVEPENESPHRQRLYDFSIAQYQDALNKYQPMADSWNNVALHDPVEGVRMFNNIQSEYNTYIRHNSMTGEYFVDGLRLWCDQYQRIITAYSGNDLTAMVGALPNAHIVNDDTDRPVEQDTIVAIEAAKAEYEADLEADTEKLKEVFTGSREALFKYVAKEADDGKLKARIKDYLPLMVEDLCAEDRELVDRRYNIAVKAISRYLGILKQYGDHIDDGKVTELVFMTSNQKYGKRIRQMASLANVELYEAGEDIEQAATRDQKGHTKLKVTRAHLDMIRDMATFQGQRISSADLHSIVESKSWYKTLELNERQWVEEVKLFFKVRRHRTKHTRYVQVDDRVSLGDILGLFDITQTVNYVIT